MFAFGLDSHNYDCPKAYSIQCQISGLRNEGYQQNIIARAEKLMAWVVQYLLVHQSLHNSPSDCKSGGECMVVGAQTWMYGSVPVVGGGGLAVWRRPHTPRAQLRATHCRNNANKRKS